MKNYYLPAQAKILKIREESPDSNLYTLRFVDEKLQQKFRFVPGQFVFAGLIGFGEAPFDICSSSLETKTFEICVRRVGLVTKKIHELKKDETMAIRGPYGHGFPLAQFAGKNLILIGGGCGFITMRTVILDYLKKKPSEQRLQVFLGASSPDQLLFQSEYETWRKRLELQLIVSKPEASWTGPVGVITDLLDRAELLPSSLALLCGPPVMYRFCLEKLLGHGLTGDEIYFSLERRMDCGVGVCQHCAIGSKYACQDGPVFSYNTIKDISGAI